MEYRTLDITIQYARDLNKVNLFTKMAVYAVVSISGGDNNSKQETRTPVDRAGGDNPTWDFPMKFTVEEAALQNNALALEFKLVCKRTLGDKDVGGVRVPIKELLDSTAKPTGTDGKQLVSYQVRKPSGKPKGQLAFLYKFGEKTVRPTVAPTYGSAVPFAPPPVKVGAEPVMAYPAGSSSAYPPYPPPAAYPAGNGKEQYPPQGVYPPAGFGPPPAGYGYPQPPPPGYGYQPQPQPGYGYPPHPGYGYPPQPVQQPAKKNKFGMGLGAGLLGGALGGLLVGDMISDSADFDGGFDF
ncbi:hypothetical protein OROHE_016674 [Orobanche hederae]